MTLWDSLPRHDAGIRHYSRFAAEARLGLSIVAKAGIIALVSLGAAYALTQALMKLGGVM